MSVKEAVEKEIGTKKDKIQDSTNATLNNMDSVKRKIKNIANTKTSRKLRKGF